MVTCFHLEIPPLCIPQVNHGLSFGSKITQVNPSMSLRRDERRPRLVFTMAILNTRWQVFYALSGLLFFSVADVLA